MRKFVAVRVAAIALLLALVVPSFTATAANDFADPAFKNVWTRTDSLVGNTAQRGYFWGPAPISTALQEQFNGKNRLVQYFDKSRMEISDPTADKTTAFYVTNGLLAKELISGKQQTGNSTFKDRWSAAIPLASDPDDANAPTYASFQNTLDSTTDKTGQFATATIDVNGKIGTNASKGSDANAKIAYFEKNTGHNIPAAFWNFLNSEGPVFNCTPAACQSGTITAKLSDPWFYASGYPISDAYWAKVKIAGKMGVDVLIQAYERRVLTYVPSLDKAYQVQVGNIGQHYYAWLYQDAGQGSSNANFPKPPAGTLNGAGSTFVNPLMSKWSKEYNTLYSDAKINYQSIGSGGGRQQFLAKTVDFGASDAPLTDDQFKQAGGATNALHIPVAMGAVVLAYNLPEIAGTKIKLSAEDIAGMYLGDITNWNDGRLAKDNPGVNFPDKPVIIVHRSDGSGTTDIFTDYLSKVSADWKSKVGRGTSVQWPIGIGAQGNEGVTNQVKNTNGAIGYIEAAYANANKIPYADVKNSAGSYITPSAQTVTNAADSLSGNIPGDLRYSITNAPGKDAYPIAGTVWLLVYKNQTDTTKGQLLANFLWWATHQGQQFSGPLDYAVLPKLLVERDEVQIKSMMCGAAACFSNK